ncbi:MAG TPA: hypothetical protein VGD69_05440 [Herpetosiphonaceae bacterium]
MNRPQDGRDLAGRPLRWHRLPTSENDVDYQRLMDRLAARTGQALVIGDRATGLPQDHGCTHDILGSQHDPIT